LCLGGLAVGTVSGQTPTVKPKVDTGPPISKSWRVGVSLKPMKKRNRYPLDRLKPASAMRNATIRACMPHLKEELRAKWFHGEPTYKVTIDSRGGKRALLIPSPAKAKRRKGYSGGDLLAWLPVERIRDKRGKKFYLQPPQEVRIAVSKLARCLRDQIRVWEWPPLLEESRPVDFRLKLKIYKP
jgi:hypothetical protein